MTDLELVSLIICSLCSVCSFLSIGMCPEIHIENQLIRFEFITALYLIFTVIYLSIYIYIYIDVCI